MPLSSPVPPTGTLRLRWEPSLAGLESIWEACLGDHNALASASLQTAIEHAQLDDVTLHYLVGEDERGIACLLPCYEFSLPLLSVASPRLQRALQHVRKLFPSFLQTRLFVAGSPISNYGDLLGFRSLHDPTRWPTPKLTAVFDAILRKAQDLGISLVLLKELETELLDLLRPALEPRFFIAPSLPSTVLSIAPSERGGYLASIRSKYRNKIKKRKSVAKDRNLFWRVVPAHQGPTASIFPLYRQVLAHADFVFEKVNQRFFEEIAGAFPNEAFYILGFEKTATEERLISSELVLCDKDAMRLVYSGFDYRIKRDSELYFNVFYAAIEEAERRGLQTLHLGQTAYEVKAELGAHPIPLSLAICHQNPLWHSLLCRLQKWLLPSTSFPHREVFSVPPPPPKNGNPNRIDLPKL